MKNYLLVLLLAAVALQSVAFAGECSREEEVKAEIFDAKASVR